MTNKAIDGGARSVFDDAANVYYPNYMELDKRLRAKLSLHDLREIFQKMVEPAIEKVRQLDREYRNEPQTPDKWWRVEVSDVHGQIVAIEPEMLTGRDIEDREQLIIRNCVEHLLGFIGKSETTLGEP